MNIYIIIYIIGIFIGIGIIGAIWAYEDLDTRYDADFIWFMIGLLLVWPITLVTTFFFSPFLIGYLIVKRRMDK